MKNSQLSMASWKVEVKWASGDSQRMIGWDCQVVHGTAVRVTHLEVHLYLEN